MVIKMSAYVLLPVTIVCCLIYSAIQKSFARDCVKRFSDSIDYTIITSLAAIVTIPLLSGGVSRPSAYTAVLGAVFGLTTAIGLVCNVLAMQNGPMSLTTLVVTCNSLIPTFSGAVFWHERITVFQAFGVVLLLAAFAIGINPKKDKSLSLKWFVCCMISVVSNGMLGVMQKIEQSSQYAHEAPMFLTISFAVVIAALLAMKLFFAAGGERSRLPSKKHIAVLLVGGAMLGAVHKTNLYLAGALPSIIFFPINNGSVLLLSAFVSRIFFKEKLSRRQIAGFVIGVAALLLVANIADVFAGN